MTTKSISYEETLLLKEKIKEAVNIRDLMIEYGVDLRDYSSGTKGTALCPFHAEGSPSFSVDYERGVYHCFGCGKKGDIITFIKEKHDFPNWYKAIEFACEKYDIDMAWTEKTDEKTALERARLSKQSEHVRNLKKLRTSFDLGVLELSQKINFAMSLTGKSFDKFMKMIPFIDKIDELIESDSFNINILESYIDYIDGRIRKIRYR